MTAQPDRTPPSRPGARRVLVLAPFAPRLDASMGGPRMIAQLVTALAARHRVGLLHLCAAGEAPADEQVRTACELVVEIGRPGEARGTRPRLAGVLGTLRGRPTWVREWWSPEFALALRSLVAGWQPDIVQAEFHLMGQYAPSLRQDRPPLVLNQHEPGAMGAADRKRAGLMPGRIMPALEVRAWAGYERWLVRQVDAVVTFTERDRQVMQSVGPQGPVVVITPGGAMPAAPANPAGMPPPTLLFFGNYVHPPNIDAAFRLARDLYPRLRAAAPDLRLVLPGDRPPAALAALACEGISVPGRVPDLAPYLDEAAVVVAPLRIGGGMRVKVLEALAAGKALVASGLAVAGLGLEDGEHFLLAETDDEFVRQTRRLLCDRDMRVALAGRARRWAEAHLRWETAVDAYTALYDALIRERSLSRG